MSTIHFGTKEIHCKIVYCGPGLSGKTTNVQQLYDMTKDEAKGKLLKLDTDTERTLFFDFVPLSLGRVRGFKVRFHLYTVPGQVFYAAARKLIMKNLDGAVFVADSHPERWDGNLESFEDFVSNLEQNGQSLQEIPYVLQCNKRDITAPMPLAEMEAGLNPYNAPCIPASALTGEGITTTLKVIARRVLSEVKSNQRG